MPTDTPPISVNIAVLTVSDTRTDATDTSGQLLTEHIRRAGHRLAQKAISVDDIYRIRALVSQWIADPEIQVIIVNGGTGITGRDGTPEAIAPLLDKRIDGFGELFRYLSYKDIGTSALASRAIAGTANRCFVFCIPGSPNACDLAWESLIAPQLDSRNRPCNLVQLMPRLKE